MAGSSSIYRIDTAGDTEADARTADQIIEFNDGTKPDTTGTALTNSCHWRRSTNRHGNPKRALDKIQDGKLGIKEVVITGYFTNTSSTLGPDKFDEWMREDATNSSLPFGRFGVRVDDYASATYNLVPTATKGYILYDVQTEDVESPAGIGRFIARLYRNGDPT